MALKESTKVNPRHNIYTSRINFLEQSRKQIEQEIMNKMRAQELEKENARLDAVLKENETKMDHVDAIIDEVVGSPSLDNFRPMFVKRDKKLKKLLEDLEDKRMEYLSSRAVKKETSCLVDDDDDVLECDNVDRKIPLRIRWQGNITRISMKRNEPFRKMIPELASTLGIDEDHILLSHDETMISPDDTPKSLFLGICDILDCWKSSKATDVHAHEDDHNSVRLKLQTQNRRNTVELSIKKDEPMSTLMERFAEQTGFSLDKMVFKFDGDILEPDQTAEELDLEEGYCIDVVVSS